MPLFDNIDSGERTILVHLSFRDTEVNEELQEFRELAASAGVFPLATLTGSREVPDPRYFVGSGKAQEIKKCVAQCSADIVLFNHALTPAQERNLERLVGCRVLDRAGLILDIFAQRARTYEGKLQVELAQLQHLSTRLVRGWTHLERQKGGIGLRGPGEMQLETDRRLIGQRIKHIHQRLEKVRRQRQMGRKLRRKAALPIVSLVGYTNAGKSTLFNRLTGAAVYAADKLFATLDPTLRRIELSGCGSMVLTDTVGFIRHLPHDLVAAFRATLEEVREANLLLHVIDAHDEQRHERIEQVNEVIQTIGASRVSQVEVYNKLDLQDNDVPRAERNQDGRIHRVWLSAKTGAGLEYLTAALSEQVREDTVRRWLQIPASAGRLRARLFQLGAVRQECGNEDGGWMLEVELQRRRLDRLCRDAGLDSERVAVGLAAT